jgi:hypothetical protein
MKRQIAILIMLGTLMNSCYFLDDIFDPPKEKVPTLQDKSEEAISDYIKTNVEGLHKPYGFGTITIHKPIEIIELEQLEKQNKEKPSYKLEKKIERKKKIIKRNNIERTLDLDHFFTIKDSIGRVTVYETNFLLNDTLGVKDISAKILLKLPEGFEEILDYFFYEYNIFLTHSFVESRELSQNFYAFFKKELEAKTSLQEKSAFLLHALKLCKQIRYRGSFEQQKILETNTQEYISDEKSDILNYQSLTFSTLYQTMDDNNEELKGYYFFHKFSGVYGGVLDTNVVLIEFTPYYEIDNVFQMGRPFEQYFNN